jgi:glycosyltransferase involved in cell wall biosynthesis
MMNNECMVTVLTASYNPGVFLEKAVESVSSQSIRNWKHVIVDDASTDDSLLNIEDYLNDSRVTLLKNEENIGQSKSQNKGLEVIDTPYILMLDSDDWLYPSTLELLLRTAKTMSDDVALICGNKTVHYQTKEGITFGKYKRTGGRLFDNKYDFLLENYVPYPRFYKTSALKEIGGWPTDDPHEGRYVEDRRIDVRLIEKYKILWIDELLYNYRKHESNLTTNLHVMNEMIEWNIRDALKRWGDIYDPIFTVVNGWKTLAELKPK